MLKFTEFVLAKEETSQVKYAPPPPKKIKKPPIIRSNASGVLEVLRQRIAAFKNHLRTFIRNPNIKHNNKVLGLVAGDIDKNETALTESYDSFNIAKPAGYGTFLTAADLGIKIKAGFAHRPSVDEEIEKKSECECDECMHERYKTRMKRKKMERNHD
jgi:hypothetical protein